MTYEAAIAILPATSLERLNDPAWLTPDRLMADASGIKLFPRREPVALLVDHDKQRPIGSVKSLMRLDAADPAGKWVVAIVEVTERPDWLRRGTPASPALNCSRMCSFGNPILRSAYVTEVSLLTPGLEPAEPDAKVLYVKPTEPRPGVVREIGRRRVDGDLVIDMSDGTQEIHCLSHRTITRYGIGKVTGIR